MRKAKAILNDQRILLAIVILLMVIIVGTISPKFVQLSNIMAIFQQVSVLGVLTMCMSLLIISGGIDLSLGNMMALSAVVVASLLMQGKSLLLAVTAGVLTSTVCGLFNGLIITTFQTIPLIITLGTGQIFNGISLLIAGGSFLQFENKLNFLREIKLFNYIPLMVAIMLLCVGFMGVLVNKTKFGRRVVAIGGNEKNAYLSGINVKLYKIIAYTLSGAMVSIAGLILASRLNSITANAGSGYELDAMVACVMGGVTLDGGRGTIIGAFLGCLLTGVISNALDILGVHAYVKIIITGAIIVTAVVLSNISSLKRE
ncbi:MAG: ABC transporter permease [Clostridiaceae bacterium]|nr:ABC transporter permease [Clostridiaceae bacterium]